MTEPLNRAVDDSTPKHPSPAKETVHVLARQATAARDTEPSQVEAAWSQLGQSRRLFNPVGRAIGTNVLPIAIVVVAVRVAPCWCSAIVTRQCSFGRRHHQIRCSNFEKPRYRERERI